MINISDKISRVYLSLNLERCGGVPEVQKQYQLL